MGDVITSRPSLLPATARIVKAWLEVRPVGSLGNGSYPVDSTAGDVKCPTQ